MERMKENRQIGKVQQGSRRLIYEDFQPSFEWTHDPASHILHIDLPGFRKEDLEVQFDSSGKLTVKGERQACEIKHIRLDKSFEVPKDSILHKVSGKLEDGRLFLTIPRKEITEEKEEEPIGMEKPKKGEEDGKKGTSLTKEEKLEEKVEGDWEKDQVRAIKEGIVPEIEKEDWFELVRKKGFLESGIVNSILEKINKNKRVIAVAVAAFSIGYCVSRKLRSRGQ